MNNFLQFNFREIDSLSGDKGDGIETQKFFHGIGSRSYLVRVFLLEVCDWLKCKECFDWLANDVGESKTVSVSGISTNSRVFERLIFRTSWFIL